MTRPAPCGTDCPTSSTVDPAPAVADESTARKREASDIAAAPLANCDLCTISGDLFDDDLWEKLRDSRGLFGCDGVGGALGVGPQTLGQVGDGVGSGGAGVGHGAVSIGDDRGTLPATEGESDARDV